LHYTAPHWPWSAPSVETAARQRETERSELTEGGNTRIYGEMMQCLDAGIGRVLDAFARDRAVRTRLLCLPAIMVASGSQKSGRLLAAHLTCWKAASGYRKSAAGRVGSPPEASPTKSGSRWI
jgi:hypothetical protein